MITLVTGASSSGKSLIAETIAVTEAAKLNCKCDNLFYIATMHVYDKDGENRVQKHRNMRADKGFQTIEKYTNIGEIELPPNSSCLIECMSNLLANEMYDKDGAKDNSVNKILSDIALLAKKAYNLVIVTNEVFSDGNIYDEFCTEYISNLGLINQKIAGISDTVIESVVGIPVYLKGNNYAYI